jgi:hypothetical protein
MSKQGDEDRIYIFLGLWGQQVTFVTCHDSGHVNAFNRRSNLNLFSVQLESLTNSCISSLSNMSMPVFKLVLGTLLSHCGYDNPC